MSESERKDRRNAEWAEMRADIALVLAILSTTTDRERLLIIRAYHVGFRRGAGLKDGQ
jgi:hypothetical protein